MIDNWVKKGLVIAVIILFICMCINPSFAVDNIKKSSMSVSSGNILYVGGSGPGNYTRIQDAIDNASVGDTVFVFDDSSPYYECLFLNKTISLVGEDKDTTIIDGNKSIDVIGITANNVRISRFTVQNSGINQYDTGIKFINGNYCTISSCIITNNKVGLCFEGVKNNTIINCTVVNNYNGILFKNEINELNKILNCTIRGNSYIGVQFEHILLFHRLNVINGNIISNNQVGIAMITSESNEITNNLICNNSVCGIAIETCMVGCDNQMIYYNNFINNSQHASDKGQNTWYNAETKKGNYWDDYRGKDILPPYGIGDMPYKISGDLHNRDWYPLMQPYPKTYNNQASRIQSITQQSSSQQSSNNQNLFVSLLLKQMTKANK